MFYIFAFMAGVFFGGFCVHSSYFKKWQAATKALHELEAKSIKLAASIDVVRKIYGIEEEDFCEQVPES